LKSRPNRALVATSLGVVAVALALPYLPLAWHLSFTPLPARAVLTIAALVATYLLVAEGAKRLFYAHQTRVEGRAERRLAKGPVGGSFGTPLAR
jgi:Mg2+-importing ATPase